MDVEQRAMWRVRWLSSIAELTNIDLQRSMWLDETNTNPHWGYVEFMCCYLDDLHLKNGYQAFIADGWVSEPEYSCLKDWHKLLDDYTSPSNDDYDNCAILNDTEWCRIVAVGSIAKAQLAKLLSAVEVLQLMN